MTTDSRKIQLETAVDATGAKAGFQQVKDSAKDMAQSVAQSGQAASKGIDGIGDGASAAGAKVDRATSNLISSIQRATAAAEAGKKSGSAFYESLANQRGVNVDVLRPYLNQLDAVTAKTKAATAAAVDWSKVTTSLGASNTLAGATTSLGATAFTKPAALPAVVPQIASESQKAAVVAAQSLDKIGMSAKQTAAALRQVPAQFTDIVTSLQAGQSPLTVLLQQGGQLKDVFGGVGPAARALGNYISSLITPLTLAAAGVGALAVAMYQGSKESEAYAKALILTGNSIGKTTDQLQGMAANIAKITGTQGEAAEALAAMAQSGKIASSSFTEVGAAVVSMNRVLGTSIDDAVGQFVKLADAPAKASADLNEKLHYLNLTTYERIRALEEQGDKEGAAALAQKSLAEATTARMAAVEKQAGVLARAWQALTHDAKEAWDIMSGLGRPQTTGDRIADLQKQLADRQARGATNSLTTGAFEKGNSRLQAEIATLSRQSLREQEYAYAQGEKARSDAAKIAASDRLNTLTKEVQTNADKRKKAIAELNKDFQTLGKATSGAEYDKLVANINEKFKDPKAAAGKAFQDDAATKMLAGLRQQEAALKEQLATDEKLTASEKERAKFVQLVADLKTKGTLTAEQKSLLANQGAIKAQLDQNVAIEKQVELKKEAAKLDEQRRKDAEEFARQIEGINISIESSNRSRQDQQDRTLEAFGLGSRARSEVEAQRSIRREFEGYQRQLTKNAAEKNQLGSDAYKEETARIKSALDDALAAQQAYFDALKEKQEDWRNGATTALADYIDYVEDAAGRARALMSNILGGLNESITDALWTGNLDSFKKFGDAIGKQIISGIVEQQLTKPLAQWMQGAVSDKDSIFSKIFGGLTSNKESGENWLGALGLGGGKSAANDALARGSTIANPLYVKSVDFEGVGSVFGSAANDSGGGFAGVLGGLFGGMSNGAATTVANALPGDSLDNLIKLAGAWGGAFADGGSPPLGKVSLVGERGPELFIPNQPGTIVPNGAIGGRSTVVHINQTFAEGTSRKTADQAALSASRALQRAQRIA